MMTQFDSVFILSDLDRQMVTNYIINRVSLGNQVS
jgi:hypothetical protein